MPQQKNGSVLFLSFFVFLTLLFGGLWYYTWAGTTKQQTDLDQAMKSRTEAEAALRRVTDERDTLRQLIGRPDSDVGRMGDDSDATIVSQISKWLKTPELSDLTAAASSLETALRKTLNDRNMQAASATSRQIDLQNKIQDLRNTVAAKDAEIGVHKEARQQAENDKAAIEAQHSEELSRINQEFDEVRDSLAQLQDEFQTLREDADLEIGLLEADIRDKRVALVSMRTRLLEREDLSFDKPDGLIANVDHVRDLAYINLGSRDELQIGTTFSVYEAANSGVGRRNTEDIKGRIEIIDIIGQHLAEARITSQDRPIAKDDPVYSPVFTSGLKVEIAVAGLIDFDGSAGSDRAEFLRMVTTSGARVAVQIDDVGEYIDQFGNPMSDADAENSISEKIRFLVIADQGTSLNEEDSLDTAKKAIYRRIQQKTTRLQDAALEHGVYVVSMSSFLEFLGYSRKRIAWRPGQDFPMKLSNGGASTSVNAALGNRISAGVTSGRYARRKRPNTYSTGQTTKLYP